MTYRLLVFYL